MRKYWKIIDKKSIAASKVPVYESTVHPPQLAIDRERNCQNQSALRELLKKINNCPILLDKDTILASREAQDVKKSLSK